MARKPVGWRTAAALLGLLLALSFPAGAAARAPYATLTQGPEGMLVGTQTAYVPDGMIRLDGMLNRPEDIFYDERTGRLYIADAGNARIAVYGEAGEPDWIGEGVLANPLGVYVAGDGRLYVADYGLQEIVVFDESGAVAKRFGRPEAPVYGRNNPFVPKKVAVDRRGNVYVVSEGSVNGVVHFNNDGEFLGFVGANPTELSLKMIVQRLIFTEEQMSRLFRSTPPSPTSLVLDRQGLLYTVTHGLADIRKLNLVGDDILPSGAWVSRSLIDIDVDAEGNIFTLDEEGLIAVYDSFGSLLFLFAGRDSLYERAGFIGSPSAIDVADSGEVIYAADRDRGVIHRYRITPFAARVFEGVALYRQGLYVESMDVWKDILKMNSNFILSYKALAKAYFKLNRSGEALESFRLAEDREGYSDAFWKIRNDWMQRHIDKIMYGAAALFVLLAVLRRLDRRYGIYGPLRRARARIAAVPLVKELLFMFHFLKAPIDAVQELKENRRATVRSATILVVWLLALQVILAYAKGYLFRSFDPNSADLPPLLLGAAVPLAFLVVMNYMVSTISDGEGRFSEVYIGSVYALSPYLLFALPAALLSNVLTLNERFVYDYSMIAIYGWCALLLCITVKELHDYTFGQTVRNLFLTGFAMAIAALIIVLVAVLVQQEIEFVNTIVQEMRNRA